jgi:hypothetical protein
LVTWLADQPPLRDLNVLARRKLQQLKQLLQKWQSCSMRMTCSILQRLRQGGMDHFDGSLSVLSNEGFLIMSHNEDRT